MGQNDLCLTKSVCMAIQNKMQGSARRLRWIVRKGSGDAGKHGHQRGRRRMDKDCSRTAIQFFPQRIESRVGQIYAVEIAVQHHAIHAESFEGMRNLGETCVHVGKGNVAK